MSLVRYESFHMDNHLGLHELILDIFRNYKINDYLVWQQFIYFFNLLVTKHFCSLL